MLRRISAAGCLLLTLAAAPLSAQDTTRYHIAFPNAIHHEARITVEYVNLPPRPLELRMSRSSPGRYALHEFAKNVYAVTATNAQGDTLRVTRPNPHQWDVGGHDGTVRVSYTLFGDRVDGTYTAIDNTHGHLNMPATFMWARGTEDRPIRVQFEPPAGSEWTVATQLVPTAAPATFTAPDLQYFMDSPTEVSAHRLMTHAVTRGGTPQTLRIALHHLGTDAEAETYAGHTWRIAEQQAAIFGEYPQFDHGTYTFIADYLPWASGDGMEHRNSTSLTSTAPLATNALGNLGTLSHEFFHSWNMERIRSAAIEPFRFDEANMSGELWFGEGFTSYYDDLTIRRAGITTDEQYLTGLSGLVSGVINAPGRRFFSPVGMSMQAPFVDAAAAIDPNNRQNTIISYYSWGAVVGLSLDLSIRQRFPGKSLDDFMRAMWVRHGRTGTPYTLADLRTVLGEVTNPAFANDFFDRYIEGRDVADLTALFANAGVLLRKARPGQPTLGQLFIQYLDGRALVRSGSLIGTPWYDAGVDNGDLILRIDGTTIGSQQDLAAVLARHQPGDAVEIDYEQRGEEKTRRITFAEDDRLEVVPYESAGMQVTDAMRAFRSSWLSSKGR